MRLEVRVRVHSDQTPDDEAVQQKVQGAIAQKATVWTDPVHINTEHNPDGSRTLTFATDAQPRTTGIVTTANVAPALLPPKVI